MWVGNPDTVMFVAGTPTALALRFNNAGPQLFDYMIVSCPQVADDTIIAIAPEGIATGFDGLPTIEVSKVSQLRISRTPRPWILRPQPEPRPSEVRFKPTR